MKENRLIDLINLQTLIHVEKKILSLIDYPV